MARIRISLWFPSQIHSPSALWYKLDGRGLRHRIICRDNMMPPTRKPQQCFSSVGLPQDLCPLNTRSGSNKGDEIVEFFTDNLQATPSIMNLDQGEVRGVLVICYARQDSKSRKLSVSTSKPIRLSA